jgi:uncharacterized protein YidB (DUF937 family)
MGLLDQVIGAALGSRGQPAPGQMPSNQQAQDPIAAILASLLAPRPAAAARRQQPGGLDELINQFKKSGFEDVINSWIGAGQNQAISPGQLREALGQKTVTDLSRQADTPQDDLLAQLSRYLPGVIDKLTPNGQLPNPADLLRTTEGTSDTFADCHNAPARIASARSAFNELYRRPIRYAVRPTRPDAALRFPAGWCLEALGRRS